MHDQSGVGGGICWMDFSEPGGHVGIEARDEGNSRRTSEPRRTDAGDRETQEKSKRSDDPADTDTSSHMTDRLYDSLEDADAVLAHGDYQGERCANVKHARENAAPGDCAGQIFLGTLDLISHDGGELQPD